MFWSEGCLLAGENVGSTPPSGIGPAGREPGRPRHVRTSDTEIRTASDIFVAIWDASICGAVLNLCCWKLSSSKWRISGGRVSVFSGHTDDARLVGEIAVPAAWVF